MFHERLLDVFEIFLYWFFQRPQLGKQSEETELLINCLASDITVDIGKFHDIFTSTSYKYITPLMNTAKAGNFDMALQLNPSIDDLLTPNEFSENVLFFALKNEQWAFLDDLILYLQLKQNFNNELEGKWDFLAECFKLKKEGLVNDKGVLLDKVKYFPTGYKDMFASIYSRKIEIPTTVSRNFLSWEFHEKWRKIMWMISFRFDSNLKEIIHIN